MRDHPLLALILGAWLGGSLLVGAAVSYNFAGFADLFARNPRLAQAAGFDPADTAAKKQSLLWVHSAELNRVWFTAWNRTQLALGALALALAIRARARRLPIGLLGLALALTLAIHLGLEPRVIDLGRALDLVPRDPPPPALAPFQDAHRAYFAADTLRFCLLLTATGLLLSSAARRSPADPDR